MTAHSGTTFEEADLTRKSFVEDTFTNCTFNGRAFRSNFAKATFTTCTFAPGFKFESCNLTATDGVDEGLVDGGIFISKATYDEQLPLLRRDRRSPVVE